MLRALETSNYRVCVGLGSCITVGVHRLTEACAAFKSAAKGQGSGSRRFFEPRYTRPIEGRMLLLHTVETRKLLVSPAFVRLGAPDINTSAQVLAHPLGSAPPLSTRVCPRHTDCKSHTPPAHLSCRPSSRAAGQQTSCHSSGESSLPYPSRARGTCGGTRTRSCTPVSSASGGMPTFLPPMRFSTSRCAKCYRPKRTAWWRAVAASRPPRNSPNRWKPSGGLRSTRT